MPEQNTYTSNYTPPSFEGGWEESALIIFVRNPVLGKVKTRLAATLGDENALAAYKYLLQHTKDIAQNVPVTKFVFYADEINDDDLWNEYVKKLQTGNDLGERMRHAFEQVFALGYKKASIIGSDCYELSGHILTTAFAQLHKFEIILGPASDGGYYLLGMQSPLKNLFNNITWSSNTVFADTMKTIRGFGLLVGLLPQLSDVDEEKDINFKYKD